LRPLWLFLGLSGINQQSPSCPGACPPGSLRLVLHLTAPCGSPTRPRSCGLVGATALGSGHAPAPPYAAGGRGARRPALTSPHRALLLPVCRIPCLGSVLHARTRVHQSLAKARGPIVCISLSRRPSAVPTALQGILPQALKAVPQSSLQPSPRAVLAAQAA